MVYPRVRTVQSCLTSSLMTWGMRQGPHHVCWCHQTGMDGWNTSGTSTATSWTSANGSVKPCTRVFLARKRILSSLWSFCQKLHSSVAHAEGWGKALFPLIAVGGGSSPSPLLIVLWFHLDCTQLLWHTHKDNVAQQFQGTWCPMSQTGSKQERKKLKHWQHDAHLSKPLLHIFS